MRKNMLSAIALLMILPAMFFTAGCAQKVVQTELTGTAKPQVPVASELSEDKPVQPAAIPQDRLQAQAAPAETAVTAFVIENIHFAFDSSELTDRARQTLSSKAGYLRENPDIRITVEGHCDDRGTDTYNLALGERRAESVKNYLISLGIGADRLDTISYGKAQPIAAGRDDASWARNRRAQFVLN